jgi:hypothetical protein
VRRFAFHAGVRQLRDEAGVDKSILAAALFLVVLQLAALPILFIANKKR